MGGLILGVTDHILLVLVWSPAPVYSLLLPSILILIILLNVYYTCLFGDFQPPLVGVVLPPVLHLEVPILLTLSPWY